MAADFVVPWKFPPAIINHDKAPLVVDGEKKKKRRKKNKPKSAVAAAKRGEMSPWLALAAPAAPFPASSTSRSKFPLSLQL